eukprot:COSAG02_NODE_38099_length_433_cov_1.014970_2_plen_59_part_01
MTDALARRLISRPRLLSGQPPRGQAMAVPRYPQWALEVAKGQSLTAQVRLHYPPVIQAP